MRKRTYARNKAAFAQAAIKKQIEKNRRQDGRIIEKGGRRQW